MDSFWVLFSMILSIWINLGVHAQSSNFLVTDSGAIADEKTDNSQAFIKAWRKACDIDGGKIRVPKGSFLLRNAAFEGPCNGRTSFLIDGTLIASADPELDDDYWLLFNKVDALTLSGNGVVDGNGPYTWSRCKQSSSSSCGNRPTSIRMNRVTNSLIQGLNFVNSKFFHLLIDKSEFVTVNNIRITAPADSPNTDGIHIARSQNIKITHSHITTGDDCVSLGDGSKNINISGVWCGPGHGISIGSLGKYEGEENVSGITVRNCTFSKTDNGLRIKTWAPSLSSTSVSDVTFANIKMVDGVDNPIIIDQYYCPNGDCRSDGESTVKIKGVRFIDVKGSAASETAVSLECSKRAPCKDIVFSGLHLTYNDGNPTTALCSNADYTFQGSPQVPSCCSN